MTLSDEAKESIRSTYAAEANKINQEYLDNVEEWYATGEGATRGYSYPRCIHGAYLWTDNDIPCMSCEEGDTLGELAAAKAEEAISEYIELLDWLEKMPAGLKNSNEAMSIWATVTGRISRLITP